MELKSDKIKEIFKNGESITVEFKQSHTKLNKDVFESVCAFLNRSGGHLLLGVEDKGNVVGIAEEAIDKVKKDFVTSINNHQKISSTFYLSVEQIKIDGKIILYIFVPESSQVDAMVRYLIEMKTEILILPTIRILFQECT